MPSFLNRPITNIFSSSVRPPHFQNVNLSMLSEDVGQSILMKPNIFCTLRGGNKECLEEMIESGELISCLIDRQGNSILHLVVTRNDLHIVELIVSSYPNLIKEFNSKGETIFHVAAGAGHFDVVKVLVDFLIYVSDQIPLAEWARPDTILPLKNDNGDTALHVALKANHMKVASCLVGGHPNASFIANIDNISPLHLAVEAGCDELVKEMLASSTTDHAESSTSSLASRLVGDCIVHTALNARKIDILKALHGMDPNLIKLKDGKSRTCLSFAAFIGFYEGFSYLLKKSVSEVFIEDEDGFFPIHLAAKGGHVGILRKFYKCFPNSKELLNKEGQNILHIAAENGRASTFIYIHFFDKKKKMINEQDVKGNTPFHLATIHRQAKIVTAFVLLGGGNLRLKNNAGQTVMDIAETNLQSNYIFRERLILLAVTCAQQPIFMPFVPRFGNRSAPPDAKAYKKLVNTLLVVTTLLVTVTLASAFTIPGGYNSTAPNLGMSTLAKKTAFQVFIICNTVAMGTSVVALVFLLRAQLDDINIVTFIEAALNCLMLALFAMPISFTAGVVLVVNHIPKLTLIIMILAAVLLSPIPFLLFPFYLQYLVFWAIYIPYTYLKYWAAHNVWLFPWLAAVRLYWNYRIRN